MNDVHRPAGAICEFVGEMETVRRLGYDPSHYPARYVLAASAGGAQKGREVLTRHVLHANVVAALGETEVVDLHHVLMVQLGSKTSFVEEHPDEVGQR